MQQVNSSISTQRSMNSPVSGIWKLLKNATLTHQLYSRSTRLTLFLSVWNTSRLTTAWNLQIDFLTGLLKAIYFSLKNAFQNLALFTRRSGLLLPDTMVKSNILTSKDNEYFYALHSVYSFDDSKKQLKVHCRKYNSFPMCHLCWKSPKEVLHDYLIDGVTYV